MNPRGRIWMNYLFILSHVSEDAIIAEYEASLQLAEASLSATVEQLHSDDLICPICKRLVVSYWIYCCMTLNFIQFNKQSLVTWDNFFTGNLGATNYTAAKRNTSTAQDTFF